jgi:hydroxymethylpyrimidine pyrophosphatase-like HAD family hydrolase
MTHVVNIIKNIKVVIMDGDGSSLTSDVCLPDNLRDLMLKHTHIKWIMATGRSLDLLKHTPIVDYLSVDVPHVLDGGSRIMYLNGTSELDYFITDAELEKLHNILKSGQLEAINFIYYSPDGINGYAFSNYKKFEESVKLMKNVTVTNEIALFKDWTKKYKPTKILLNVKDVIELGGLYWHGNDNNIDITAHGVNKGLAVFELIKRLKINQQDVAFVFNDKNDLPVLDHPDLQEITTVKVGHALPEINANYHVDTPFDVANVLVQLIQ